MKKLAVGILAHVDSGKTTLSEALMYCSGNISKLGRVDHGNSFLDTFQLERDRGITIFSKQAILKFNDTEFTLLDTPGHVDFSTETERTLQVLDYAILVVSGTNSVQSHTHTLWKLLNRYNVPVFIFVNKMDLDGAYKEKIMLQLKNKLSESCVDFSTNIPEQEFFENVAVCHNSLLEEYYENEKIDIKSIIEAIKKRRIFPCFFGSALKLQGVSELLNGFDLYTEMPEYGDEFGGKVFKISQDKQGNRLTFLKVTGGRLVVRNVLESDKNKNSEKVNQIRIYSGEKFISTDSAKAGTICAVTGISFAQSGDCLGKDKSSVLPVLEPVLTYRVELPQNIDAHTAIAKLKILQEEDPKLNIVWNKRLREIQIQLMGEIQLEILKSIILERFGFQVEFGTGNIIYKETIANTVEGVGHFEPLKHYAEVHLILEPGKKGSGVEITTNCKEDQLDKNWQRLILTHLYEKTHYGVLTGSPLTDIKITLASGKAHPKHTEGGDFRQATYRAVRQGLMQAESILLEPVYEFTLEVPTENVGRAMADIQRMHGSFNPVETDGELSVITGIAPVATMGSYQKEVNNYTHGKGRLICSLKGYEPCHNSEEVIEKIGYNSESDIENPCDSVFCSHGAGFNVKWNEVQNYMHIPSTLNTKSENTEELHTTNTQFKNKTILKTKTLGDDIFARDKELMAIFEQTYGAIKRNRENSFKPVEKKNYNKSENNHSKKYKTIKSYTGTEYLLVDGYNVIFSWDSLKIIAKDNLEVARNSLINILCNFQGYCKCEVILVFDAYKVKGKHREVEKVNNISVVYTKEAETADAYIEKVTHQLAKNNKVRVVTSDGMEQFIILGNGALRVSSNSFLEEVKEAEKEIRQLIEAINNS